MHLSKSNGFHLTNILYIPLKHFAIVITALGVPERIFYHCVQLTYIGHALHI